MNTPQDTGEEGAYSNPLRKPEPDWEEWVRQKKPTLRNKMHRVGYTLVFFLAAVGSWVIFSVLAADSQRVKTDFEPTEAVLIGKERKPGSTRKHPNIYYHYCYEVNGVQYRGVTKRNDATEVGQLLDICYNRETPAESRAGYTSWFDYLIFPCLSLCAAIGFTACFIRQLSRCIRRKWCKDDPFDIH